MMEEKELLCRYRALDAKLTDLYCAWKGQRAWENAPLLPTQENLSECESSVCALREEIQNLEAPNGAFQIWKAHFQDFLTMTNRMAREKADDPASMLGDLADCAMFHALIDSRDAHTRAQVLTKRLSQAEDRCAIALQQMVGETDEKKSAFSGDVSYYADAISHYADPAQDRFGGDEPLRKALLEASAHLERTAQKVRSLQKCETVPLGDDRCMGMPEEAYRALLWDNLGVSLDELRSWSASEMERTRGEALEKASRAAGHVVRDMGEVNDLLNRFAGPAANPEEMFRRTRAYMDRTREAARALVTFPDEECTLEEVPYILRDSFPWGGYCDGDFRADPPKGMVILNQYNFKSVTDGWMKIQAAHEAYPGHHVQYVRAMTDPRPETSRIGAKYIPLIEGTAHRSEQVMEEVFAEDPWYSVFTAYRRHHTCVRIGCDMLLRLEGKPAWDAMELYMRELHFDEAVARGQVLAHERMPGYFTCYYYGLKRIRDLEKASGLSCKDFTEALFTVGNVSLENLEKYLSLTPSEKHLYETGFAKPKN